MPTYSYKGIDENGEKVKAVEFAKTENELYRRLKEQNKIIFDIKELKKKTKEFPKLTTKELCEFSRQIGTMQNSGVPINEALKIIGECTTKPGLKKVFVYLERAVNNGLSLSQAMSNCENAFPVLIINMYSAGELGGSLGDAALKMEKYYESETKIKSKIQSAMAYPIILLIATITMVLVLFSYVLPVFVELYTDNRSNLNSFTVLLMNTSDFILEYGILLMLAMIGVILALMWLLRIEQIRLQLDKMKLAMPKIGTLLSVIYTSRFARTLSALYSTGIPMLEAVEAASTTVGNVYVESQIKLGKRKIASGLPLSEALKQVAGIEKKLLASVYIGEESGKLDYMLNSCSEQYEYETIISIDRLLSLLEPVLLIIMGLIIGPILIGIMLPMFGMYSIM